ncbi:hypothetical protein PoB_001522300 [Plakobranchus ocellatus]|uniref:Uncharacterized protein n=1 Tax=Plakobranchus ocellatus TaxID=259542 RepID=A0AAV3Z2I5_9GAST|nr:hypothetical protein PoB_001522300 [Plakobranchus ocellatus]
MFDQVWYSVRDFTINLHVWSVSQWEWKPPKGDDDDGDDGEVKFSESFCKGESHAGKEGKGISVQILRPCSLQAGSLSIGPPATLNIGSFGGTVDSLPTLRAGRTPVLQVRVPPEEILA